MNLVNPYRFAAAVSTSYSNTGGSGNRTSIITLTQSDSNAPHGQAGNLFFIVNGVVDNVLWISAGVADGKWVKYDFGSAKIINEAKFYQSGSQTQGNWKWQGSNDDSTYTDIGSSFGLGGTTVQTITAISSNTTAYRYYRLIKVSGSTNATPYSQEMQFKISA